MDQKFSKLLSAALIVSVCFLMVSTISQAQVPQDESGSIKVRTSILDYPSLAKIGYQDAMNTALKKTPGGILELELESEHGYLVFCVEIVTDKGELIEYQIDAGNSAILSVEEEDDEDKDEEEAEMKSGTLKVSCSPLEYPKLAKIKPVQAIETAMSQIPGSKLLALELEGDDGILVYEVVLVTSGRSLMDVEIDAGTGAIIEMEEEEFDRDDED